MTELDAWAALQKENASLLTLSGGQLGVRVPLLEISLRKECGFTQREAAVLNNVSLPFLNPLEQGKETALHVSKRFGIALTLALPTYQNQIEVVSP